MVGDDAVHAVPGDQPSGDRIVHGPREDLQGPAVRPCELMDGVDVVRGDGAVRGIDLVGEGRVPGEVLLRRCPQEAGLDVGLQLVDGSHRVGAEALHDQPAREVLGVQPALVVQHPEGLPLDAGIQIRVLDLQKELLMVQLHTVHELLQRRHTRARVARAEPAARVQTGDLGGGEVPHLPGRPIGEDLLHVGRAFQVVVVEDDEFTVLRALHVVLDPADAQIGGLVHGGQRVLRSVGRSPPVGDDRGHVVAGPGVGGGQQKRGSSQERGRRCGYSARVHAYSSRRTITDGSTVTAVGQR